MNYNTSKGMLKTHKSRPDRVFYDIKLIVLGRVVVRNRYQIVVLDESFTL